MKHKKLNSLFILLSFVALIVYVGYAEGFVKIRAGLAHARPVFLLLALSMILLYWFLESLILHCIVRVFHPQQVFLSTVKTSMVGQFFNCVTPFASGGQPMQAVSMVRAGVPLGVSTCSLLIKFIVYQITLTVYSVVCLVLRLSYFSAQVQGFQYLVLLGFAINSGVVCILLSVFFFRNFTLRVGRFFLHLLHKIRLVRDPEKANEKLESEVDMFYRSFTLLKDHLSILLKTSLLSALQLTAFFLIPYFLAVACRVPDTPVVTMVCAQAFVTMVSAFVPLPGAAGGAEVSFNIFFKLFFGNAVTLAMLFWRIITFYLPIAVGIFFVFQSRRKEKIHEPSS